MAGTAQRDHILRSINRRRFRFSSERELQDGLEAAFRLDDLAFEREAKLGGDLGRPDFLFASGTVVEVKIKGSPSAVASQILSYAQSPRVTDILVVTARMRSCVLPERLGGKPVTVVGLWKSFLA